MPGVNWTEEEYLHWSARQNPKSVAEMKADSDCLERDIQEECVKLMQEDGWRALRTDPVSDKSRGKGFGELGMADYLFMRKYYNTGPFSSPGTEAVTQMLWVEFKSRNGEPKKHQTDWHAKERARGFCTWIASVDFPASVEGFREHYAASGLMRRARWW